MSASTQAGPADAAAEALPERRRKPRRRALRRVLPWLVIVVMFLVWELAVRAFRIEEFVLPAP